MRKRTNEDGPISAIPCERGLIGILLASCGEAFSEISAAGISTDSFWDSKNKSVWAAAERLHLSGKPINQIVISSELGEEIFDYLTDCIQGAPIRSHGLALALEVIGAQKQRAIAQAARTALEMQRGGSEWPAVLKALKEGLEAAETSSRRMAGIMSALDFVAVKRPEPPEVIHGVLRSGQVGMLSAASKAGKTWGMLALGMAVSAGIHWLGWGTTKGRALYINGELPPWDMEKRLEKLASALGLQSVPDGLDVWHLRGEILSIRQLVPDVVRRQEVLGTPYAIVIPDPLYCFAGGRDENDNSEQAVTMHELGELSERTGAATMAAHHFSKGNQADKEHLDRGSGAGMFARAVDTFLTLTKHEVEDHYTVETTARSFAKPKSFVVKWDCPLWKRDDQMDPEKLKTTNKPGRPKEFSALSFAKLVPKDGIKHGDWEKLAFDRLGATEKQFRNGLQEALNANLVSKIAGSYFRGERFYE